MYSDSHNDFLTKLDNDSDIRRYIEYVGDNNVCCAVYTGELIDPIDKIEYFASLLSEFDKLNLMLTIEDCTFLCDSNIDRLVSVKPFSCGLTWNYDNTYAGGASGDSNVTSSGKRLVHILEKNGIIVDTAHMNHKSIDDILNITNMPVFNSHSNIYACCNHDRNLLDRHLKAISDSNGYLGINFVDYFLDTPKGDIDSVVKHIDYFVQRYGCDNIGLGTDFNGSDHLVMNGYEELNKLSDKLSSIGYSLGDIDKIMYKNFQDFVKRVTKNVKSH